MSKLSETDIVSGKFLLEIIHLSYQYQQIYGGFPAIINVDREHYELLKACRYFSWIDVNTMTVAFGTQIVLEPRWVGAFMFAEGTLLAPG